MLTLAWMIETLREECALKHTSKEGVHALARQIAGARASELSDDEMDVLVNAGRDEALTEASPVLVEGFLAAAVRAFGRASGIGPDPDADEIDWNGDAEALLNVLAFGLVRLSRDEDH